MDEINTINYIIIPPFAGLNFVTNSEEVFLRECVCRLRQKRCPPGEWEVCLLFKQAPEKDRANARPIPKKKAIAILRSMAERGSIFRLFYRDADFQITELCSCCTCCCSPYLRLKRGGIYKERLRSEYRAEVDVERCSLCGECVTICAFEARSIEDNELVLNDARCFGCGCCIEACPENAIALIPIPGRGVPLKQFRTNINIENQA